jgi:energy-coupling factor transporter transmembrane protein EcfT
MDTKPASSTVGNQLLRGALAAVILIGVVGVVHKGLGVGGFALWLIVFACVWVAIFRCVRTKSYWSMLPFALILYTGGFLVGIFRGMQK